MKKGEPYHKNPFRLKVKTCHFDVFNRDKTFRATVVIDRWNTTKVLSYRWSLESRGYVRSVINGKGIKLHNFILGKKGVDHINRNKLDNRESNLRLATHSLNNHNKGSFRNNTSGVKGVCQYKNTGRWCGRIRINGVIYQRNCATKKEAIAFRKQWENYLIHKIYPTYLVK